MKDRTFTLVVDDVPVEVTWDSSLGRLAAIGDESSTLPDNVEVAIAERLQAGKY
jgi:hypothetical protein